MGRGLHVTPSSLTASDTSPPTGFNCALLLSIHASQIFVFGWPSVVENLQGMRLFFSLFGSVQTFWPEVENMQAGNTVSACLPNRVVFDAKLFPSFSTPSFC